jgi:spore maturation protein CgeB
MLKVLPHVDLYLSWSKRLIPLLEHAGAKKVLYFPFGYDTDIFVKTSTPDEYVADLLFIGTWSIEREAWFIQLLQRMPALKLHILGTGWMDRTSNEYLLTAYIRGDALHATHLPSLFSRAKISINFLRPQNFDAHNMRSIEVPATGNFLLTQRSAEQSELLFEEGKSIVCFETIDELVEKIEYYLSHEEERLHIARAAYEVAQRYSLDNLLQHQVQHFLKKGINKYDNIT